MRKMADNSMEKTLAMGLACYDAGVQKKLGDALNSGDKSKQAKAMEYLFAFQALPEIARKVKPEEALVTLRAFTGKNSIPAPVQNVFEVFRNMESVDMKVSDAVFRTVTLDASDTNIEVADVTNGLVVEKILPGEPVKMGKISGTLGYIPVVTYAGGLNWPWELIEDRKIAKMISIAEEEVARFYHVKMKALLGIIADAANTGGTSTAGASTNAVEKVIQGINKAIIAIETRLKDVYPMDPASYGYVIVANAGTNENLVRAALGQTQISTNVSELLLPRNISLLTSYNLKESDGTAIPATEVCVCVAKHKFLYADKVKPEQRSAEDIGTLSTSQVIRARFAAGCADTREAQIATIA